MGGNVIRGEGRTIGPLEDKVVFLIVRAAELSVDRFLRLGLHKDFSYVRTIAANITIPPLQQEDVEEVASDAFLAVWNHAAEIEDGKLKSYLAAVTRNLAKNKLRYLHLSVPLEEEYMILTVPDVEEELLEKDIRRLTRQAVDNLPEPDRSIFMRYYFLYQKTDEIAAALELNSAAVRQRLSRGREKLKKHLEERGYHCEDCYR